MVATFLRPDADSSDGSWLDATSSNVNLFSSVDESTFDDADYIRSSNTNGDLVRLRLSDPGTGVTPPIIIRYRVKSEGTPAQMYGMLTQSTSTSTGLIAQWELEPTSSFATNTYTLSAAEAALITDFNDLYVSFASYSTAPHLTANIDLNFQTGEYYEVGVPQSTITSTSYLSCSRASIGYAKTAAGTLTQFANDTLRIGVGTGLLVEDSRTNLLTNSQTGNGNWTNNDTTITDNNVTAPDGTATADTVYPNTNNINHFARIGSKVVTANPVTFSFYAKNNGYNFVGLIIQPGVSGVLYEVVVDLTSGVITQTTQLGSPTGVSSSVETLASGWFRVICTIDAGVASNCFCDVAVLDTGTPGSYNYAFVGNASLGVAVWGNQLEQASFVSSYIPTTTTSATRAHDLVTCIGSLDTILSALPQSVVFDVTQLNQDPGVSNYWTVLHLPAGYGYMSGTSQTKVSINGIMDALIGNSLTTYIGAKMGYWQSTTDIACCGGGGTVSTDTTDGTALVSAQILNHAGGNTDKFGIIRRLTVWNSQLANATLQALTAP